MGDVTGETLCNPLTALWLALTTRPRECHTRQSGSGVRKQNSPRFVFPFARTDRRGLMS